jgi:hypothetical protein
MRSNTVIVGVDIGTCDFALAFLPHVSPSDRTTSMPSVYRKDAINQRKLIEAKQDNACFPYWS